MLNQAKKALQDGDYKTCIDLTSKLIVKVKDDFEVYALRAVAYRKIQEFHLSLADFDKAIELAPKNADLRTEKGVTLFHNKTLDSALVEMNIAAELDPQNPYRYSSRAYIKDAMKDINGAISDYRKAVALDPDDAVAYNNLGMLEEKQGNLEKAKKHFDRSDRLQGIDMKKIANDAVVDGGVSVKNSDAKKEVLEVEKQESQKQDGSKTATTPTSTVRIMLQVFTDKEVRKDFFKYIKALFFRKK